MGNSVLRVDNVLGVFYHCTITEKGIVFVNTDSFFDRKKRFDLECKLKKQDSELKAIELLLKRKTFLIAVIGLIISILSLMMAYFKE